MQQTPESNRDNISDDVNFAANSQTVSLHNDYRVRVKHLFTCGSQGSVQEMTGMKDGRRLASTPAGDSATKLIERSLGELRWMLNLCF